MSLKTRVARIEARALPPKRLEVAWIYYNVRDAESSIRMFEDGSGARLFVGTNDPHPFPEGTHIYGIERGLPYPHDAESADDSLDDSDDPPEPEDADENGAGEMEGPPDDCEASGPDDGHRALLSVGAVASIFATLDETLPRSLAEIVRVARLVVVVA